MPEPSAAVRSTGRPCSPAAPMLIYRGGDFGIFTLVPKGKEVSERQRALWEGESRESTSASLSCRQSGPCIRALGKDRPIKPESVKLLSGDQGR